VTSNFMTLFLIASSGVYTASAMTEFNAMHLLGAAFTLESLALCIILPLAANLGNRLGRRRLFLAALAAYTGATVICAMAASGAWFVAGRTVMGAAWGLFMGNTFALVADLYPPGLATRRTGQMQAAGLVAMVGAAPVAGLFADLITWRAAFWVAVPALVAAWLLVATGRVAVGRGPAGPVDIVGVVCLAGVLTPFSCTMAWAGTAFPWASVTTVVLLGISLLCLVALVVVERRVRDGIFPVAVLANRPFLAVFGVTVLSALAGATGNFLPAFAQQVLGTSATVSGLVGMPGLGLAAVGASLLGRYLAARQRYRAVVAGWAGVLAGVTCLYFTFGPHTALILVFIAGTLMGVAQTGAQVVPYTFPMLALKPDLVPSGIALMTFGGTAANTVGAALLSAVAATGLTDTFRFAIIFGAAALIIAAFFRDPPTR
jgi:predicted MFS family arabinose efflux permease